jgi:hypothetical protein
MFFNFVKTFLSMFFILCGQMYQSQRAQELQYISSENYNSNDIVKNILLCNATCFEEKTFVMT